MWFNLVFFFCTIICSHNGEYLSILMSYTKILNHWFEKFDFFLVFLTFPSAVAAVKAAELNVDQATSPTDDWRSKLKSGDALFCVHILQLQSSEHDKKISEIMQIMQIDSCGTSWINFQIKNTETRATYLDETDSTWVNWYSFGVRCM